MTLSPIDIVGKGFDFWNTIPTRLRTIAGGTAGWVARGAANAILSDSSFVQVILHGKWVWSPSDQARILFRSELGAMYDSDFSKLPPSVRFQKVTRSERTDVEKCKILSQQLQR